MPGVMEGIRVLEVATWVAVPSACAILADWGAEVIKVENPAGGDAVRGLTSIEGVEAGDAWFQLLNRGKKSVALNLRHERGREALYRLVERADVFVTNLELPLVERFQVGYATLHAHNPRLIYGLLTGYGSQGPDRLLPGYDYTAFWARSGIMDRVSEPGRPPRPVRPGMGDNTTSLGIAAGLAAALFHRERTGQGQEVHFSLYHTAVWALGIDVQTVLAAGAALPQSERGKAANPLWNTYETSDGRWVQLAMLQADRYWPRLCQAIERPELAEDPRFASQQARQQHCQELVGIIGEAMARHPLAEWERRLREHDLVGGRVQTVLDTATDPQAAANGFFVEVAQEGERRRLVNSPIRFQQAAPRIRGLAPELGQHTEEVLLELGGYTWEEVAQLSAEGVLL